MDNMSYMIPSLIFVKYTNTIKRTTHPVIGKLIFKLSIQILIILSLLLSLLSLSHFETL